MQLKTWVSKVISLTLFVMVASCSANSKQLDRTAALEAGSSLQIIKLQDQFEQSQILKSDTKWLIFSHDMSSGKLVKAAFEGMTSAQLEKLSIQYYADISGMPSLISRFIAIPKMKKLKYSIILGREGGDLAQFPRKEDQVTLIKLQKGKVSSIQFYDSAEPILPILNQS